MLWDIFCRVIDNFGDIGVCWRLSADLAARGHSVRLWVDDATALAWMAPGAQQGTWPRVQVLAWGQSGDSDTLKGLPRSDVWIESFGCEVPLAYVTHFVALAGSTPLPRPVWINLEYLSAEAYVERSHTLPSPVMQGPATGWTKHFFYPGFTAKTGGLLREPGLASRAFADHERNQFLAQHGVDAGHARLISLFCYEPPLLQALLENYALATEPTVLLVTHGRATKAVQALWGQRTRQGLLQVVYLPLLSQLEYDLLLGSCDLNFVRGEDSVIRAIWAEKPFVWQIYPQDDGADAPKLEAFMAQMQFSTAVRKLHRAWNGSLGGAEAVNALGALQPEVLTQWRAALQAPRERLLKMDDLTSQLVQFVLKNR